MRTQWTREKIIRALVERQATGLRLTVGGAGGVDASLYGAARRTFGSWRNAIEAAGIAPQRVLTWERWSPARILVMIRHLARRDRPLTTLETERRYHNLVSAGRRHYGSWSKAVLAAGVEPTRLRRVVAWTPDRVIEAVLTRALRGQPLTARSVEPRSLVEAGQRFYGSWSAAVCAAGLDPVCASGPRPRNTTGCAPKSRSARTPKAERVPRKPWSGERVIEALHARLRERRPMHSNAIARDDMGLYHAMRRYLRNWSTAMRAAGLDPDVYHGSPYPRSTHSGSDPGDRSAGPAHGSDESRTSAAIARPAT